MRKKLVWVYVLLVLAVIIITSSGFVVAAGTSYDVSCASPYTLSRTSAGIFDLPITTYNAISDVSDAIWNRMPAATLSSYLLTFEGVYRINRNLLTPTCSVNPYGFSYNRNWDNTDRPRVLAGGYVYTSVELTNLSAFAFTYSTSNRDYLSKAVFLLYNLTGYTSASSLDSYIVSSKRIAYGGYRFIDSTSTEQVGWSTYGVVDWYAITVSAGPGLYYVASGIGGDVPSTTSTNTISSKIEISFNNNFNRDADGVPVPKTDSNGFILEGQSTNDFINNTDLRSIDANGVGYLISNRPLSIAEINTNFKEQVNKTRGLCELTGGDYNVIISDCCGNDVSDEGQIVNTADKGNYTCINKKWIRTDLGGVCVESSPYQNADYKIIFQGMTSPKITTIKNGTDNCCGDDIPGDYGFIASVPKSGNANIYQYLCYADFSGINNFRWLNAINNASKILTLNKTNADVDVISNSEEWFYCDATNNVQMDGGKAIGEGKSFSNRFADGNYSCAEWITSSSGGQLKFDESCTWNVINGVNHAAANCCDVIRPLNTVKTANDISQCDFDCYLADDSTPRSIAYINSVIFSLGTGVAALNPTDGYVDMDSCIANPSSCIDGTGTYSHFPYLNCSSQPSSSVVNHVLCNSTSFCKGGIFRSTNESNASNDMSCCVGANASCTPLVNITDADSCVQYGKLFSPNAYTNCTTQPYLIPGTGKYCCLGSIFDNSHYLGQSTISNTSIICFKEQGNNILSQCCYDSSCENSGYFNGGTEGLLSFYDRRVLTKGSSIHTITNFDTVRGNGTNALIQNRGYRMVINGGAYSYSPGTNEISHFPMFDGFSYLEFDLLTDADDLVLSLNGIKFGDLTNYSNNGGSPKVIHHIILPLDNRFSKTATLETLDFSSAHYANSQFTVIIDNIALVPSTYDINTRSYYCTGGFEGWVDDLDAPIGTTDYSVYGPHMLACIGIASYGWTGSQCCGDDTKPRPVEQFFTGEFFNDTIAGCFAGSKVRNNQTVADSKGIWEDVVNPEADHLHTFNYSDLLYYNNSFIGCQVPQEKYANVNISYNGTPTSSKLLLSSNIITRQCAVAGPYYCMNGVWRKQIKVYGDSNAEEFPGQQILVKTIPPGAELLANGFRGN